MNFLDKKRLLIVGLASERSIAYGIAQAMHRFGAELAFTYQGERLKDRVENMAATWGSSITLPCDVGNDDEIEAVFKTLRNHWGTLDGVVHSVAYAPQEQLDGDFLECINREGSRIAHDISSYSFAALAKASLPLMLNTGGALLTLTYLGAERVVPRYNVMGLAKASLEANVRYLAHSLGPKGIRVNGISAGPIKTLAAAGIKDFRKMLAFNEKTSPLRRNVSTQEVGHVAAFLCSELASGITGEIIHVDAGFHAVAFGEFEPGT